MGRGARQLLWHTTRAGRTGAGSGARRPVRYRLARHIAALSDDAQRCRQRLRVATLGLRIKARLERRAEDSDEVIARRLRNAGEEIPHWTEYDYVLINSDLEESFAQLRAILTAERLKRILRSDLEECVAKLLDDLRRAAT